MNCVPLSSFRARSWIVAGLVLTGLSTVSAAPDLHSSAPGTGQPESVLYGKSLCDVWQSLFNGWGLHPDADEDKDGCSNYVESIAGTDPRNASDCIKVGNMVISSGNILFTFEAEAGKKYRVLSDSSPGGAFTTVVSQLEPVPGATFFVPIADSGTQVIKIAKEPGDARMFYRLEVTDVDSDNDGVSDWGERRSGLNPLLAQSSPGVSDLTYVSTQVALPSEVSIEAATPFASEDGPTAGSFLVKRTSKLLPFSVNLTSAGTAAVGADYTALPSEITFGVGEESKTINVTPIQDPAPNVVEGSKSVTASLVAPAMGAAYTLGDTTTATVIIQDSAAPAGTGLLARYYDTASSNAVDAANFGQAGTYSFTRGSPTTTGSIVVTHGNASVGSTLQTGQQVKLSFTSGNLNSALYNHLNYTVTAVTSTTCTVSISAAAALPTSGTGNCSLSIQTFPHPAVITRVDPTVNFEWMGGTANGNGITPANSPDNYSSVWEAYLSPSSAGNYTFQLDADDKARVLLDTGSGLVQILEHGWDSAATVGTFKQSAPIALAVPASAAQRYRIRVEHVETTGEARCRLQWRLNSGGYANIPQANTFTHTEAATYTFNRISATNGTATITLNGHGFVNNDSVTLAFSASSLFTPNASDPAGYSKAYTVTNATTNTFDVAITGTNLPATVSTAQACFVENRPASATTGWFNEIFANTTFSNAPGRVGVDSSGPVTSNNGLYGIGSPNPSQIAIDTFSVRWSGQVQPQFTEEYTFSVLADDGCTLRINGQIQELKQLSSTNVGGATYVYDGATGSTVITYTNAAVKPSSFTVGEVVKLDPTSGSLSALGTLDYTITAVTSTTFTVNFGTGIYASGSGNMNIDFLNKPQKDWASNGAERFVRIPMIGGVRYDIQLDYWENGGFSRCILYWFSPSQPKQVIPSERLYPSGSIVAPPAHIAATEATALVGGLFSLPISTSNGGNVTLSGLPAWLTFSGGVLSGTPPPGSAGKYQILVNISNLFGSSTSVLNLEVSDTGSSIVREYWNGVSGTTVATIPTSTAPTGTENLTLLQATTDFGDNYGARIRGYITAPTTGNYYFWIAASQAAELWISNDDEPINIFKRAWVTTGSSTPQNWTAESTQKSPWLALEQGKKYYIEILHKAGTGAGDNLAVGWSKPGESITAPTEVVPGYVLSPYVVPTAGSSPGTLYVATLLAQNGAVTKGVGRSTLRVSEDENSAVMTYSYTGLTGPITSQHIHTDPYLSKPSEIVYDIDTPATPGDGLQSDGSYKWTITDVGSLTKAEIVEIIKQGKAYINLHTAAYPNGEIRGNYTLANGSRTFTPPPAPPAWSDDGNTDNGASRFLAQATFGANIADITALKNIVPSGGKTRYELWIEDQFTKPATQHLPEVLSREIGDVFGPFDVKVSFNTWWKNSMTGQDQLRQKVAFALSQIHVVSGQGPLEDNSRALSDFYDTLLANAFGNFRDILVGTTLTPAMGRYLDMLRNDKPDLTVGRIPNENYAREIKQLFSVGLYRMWPDGTLMLTSKDSPIDTYTQREIVGFSHVFTGWDYGYDGAMRTALNATADWTRPMREVPARHFTGPKRTLNNVVFPGLSSVAGQPLDPYATHNSTHFADAAYQALPAQELEAAHDQLFNHPNVGPFICRQLIQRLVTSHPSRDYIYRVVQKFNDNGSGVRGDMKAVLKAILLDYEARSPQMLSIPAFGKQREPLQRVTNAARAFRPTMPGGTYSQNGTNIITIDTSPTPHRLATGNRIFMEFTDTTGDPAKPAPTTGTYVVVSVPNSTSYTVAAAGWMTGTFNQTAGSSTLTVTMNGHWLPAGGQAYFDFLTATTGSLPTDGVRTVATSTAVDFPSGANNVSGTTFTLTMSDTTARIGTLMVARFPSSYSCTGAGGVITIDTAYGGVATYGVMADHHLGIGDSVFLNFTNSRDTTSFNETSTENDIVYTLTGVPDPNTFTVTARSAANAAMNSDNQVYVFPLESQPLVRSGTVNALPSTFTLDNTDADLSQTPLNSPTVFNYFLPDYKYAGTLASQGITTPEFELTAETTVVRQANYLFNGIFSPSNTNGISSFVTGNNALVMDLGAWMGNATTLGLGAGPQPTQTWTSNANFPTLIDHLNTLLMGGQFPAAAKTQIQNFLSYERTISGITVSNPCAVTTSAAHNLTTGESVVITGVSGGTFRNPADTANVAINGTFAVTVTGTNSFTLTGIRCTSVSGLNVSSGRISYVPYNNTTPTDTHKRDRLRAILHFLLTSPDFTIQR